MASDRVLNMHSCRWNSPGATWLITSAKSKLGIPKYGAIWKWRKTCDNPWCHTWLYMAIARIWCHLKQQNVTQLKTRCWVRMSPGGIRKPTSFQQEPFENATVVPSHEILVGWKRFLTTMVDYPNIIVHYIYIYIHIITVYHMNTYIYIYIYISWCPDGNPPTRPFFGTCLPSPITLALRFASPLEIVRWVMSFWFTPQIKRFTGKPILGRQIFLFPRKREQMGVS